MALIIEDGTGVADADSYRSEADAVIYVNARYPSDPFVAGTLPEQEQWMRQGAQQLDAEYGLRTAGAPTNDEQGLLWPRINAVDSFTRRNIANDVVPSEVGDAQTEVARQIAAGVPFMPDLPRGGAIKREKVDVIEVEYFDKATGGVDFQLIDNLMDRFTIGSGDAEFKMLRA